MSLFDDLEHAVSIYSPTVTFEESSGAQVTTYDTLRAANVPCLIRAGAGGERDEFSQSERPRSTHTIAFSDYDGGVQPGDKLVNLNTGQTYRFTGDMQQEGYGGIQPFNIISVTELNPSVT